MIVRIACALLVLVANCGGEYVDSIDLNSDIKDAQNKVQTMSNASIQDVGAAVQNLKEITLYFNNSALKYNESAREIVNQTRLQLISVTQKFVGEAIDKNKPINTFKCLMKAMEETNNTILENEKAIFNCIDGVYNRQKSEVENLSKQLGVVQKATVGLYDIIIVNLQNSTTTAQIADLVQKAEVRQNNLKKLIRSYVETGADYRIQYNEAQLNCLRTAQTVVDNTMKACQNKMKGC